MRIFVLQIWIINFEYGLFRSNTIIIYFFIDFLEYLKIPSKFFFSNNKYSQSSDSNIKRIFEHPFTLLKNNCTNLNPKSRSNKTSCPNLYKS